MKILLTGAFGNIGESALISLVEKGYDVTCFDIKTDRNERKCKELSKKLDFNIIWGDITDKKSFDDKIVGIQCIIHLAAILPPMSEKNVEITEKINVGGTRNLIEVASEMEPSPKFVFASSVSIHGPSSPEDPPRSANDPLVPTDQYTHSKVACEKIIRESNLKWTIFRFGAVPGFEMEGGIDTSFLKTPYDQKVEFVHTRDVGLACANVVKADSIGKTLMIGGGESARMVFGDFINGVMEASGVGKIPREAYKIPENIDDWYYTGFMETKEAQDLLSFQNRTFQDYKEDFKKVLGIKRLIAKLFGPLIRRRIIKQSPYYKKNHSLN